MAAKCAREYIIDTHVVAFKSPDLDTTAVDTFRDVTLAQYERSMITVRFIIAL